jgi:hypothetical protein
MTAFLWYLVLGIVTVGAVTLLPFWLVLAVMLALYLWLEWLPKSGDRPARED